ncbi:MAG TPA: hypothetical protein DCL21_04630 [Alphaproteobacteria bacterium]|nr:hypothetical protein [Alphaproteobacteria bacterium]
MNNLEFNLINNIIESLSPNYSQIILNAGIGILIAKIAGWAAGRFAHNFTKAYEKQKGITEILKNIHIEAIQHLQSFNHLGSLKNTIIDENINNNTKNDLIKTTLSNYILPPEITPQSLLELNSFSKCLHKDYSSIISMNMDLQNSWNIFRIGYSHGCVDSNYSDFIYKIDELLELISININSMIIYLEDNDIDCSHYKSIDMWTSISSYTKNQS